MERRIEITPSWDKRHEDPSKNYGIACADIEFYLVGKCGAYQFKAFTGWFLPHLVAEGKHLAMSRYPNGYDVGYHAYEPQYEGQTPLTQSCELLGGKPCYYDGSGLYGQEVGTLMVSGGSDAVWKVLEERYIERFGALE